MDTSLVFASILFLRGDYSSGVDRDCMEYNPAFRSLDYINFFLEKTKRNHDVTRVRLYSLELSEHDKYGNYIYDKFNRIKRKPFPNDGINN